MTDNHPMPLFDDPPGHPESNSHGERSRQADSASSAEPDQDAVPDETSTSGVTGLSEDQVKAALRKVKDPELNLNILDLGLVYAIAVDGSAVSIDMSLTSPGCPSGPEIMTSAEEAIRAIPGVTDATVNLVWSPFWSPERIEPRIRAYLGL
jgi:metal-sulfur cluster biosynthetic enzyme